MLFLALLYSAIVLNGVKGHGFLQEPPARNSMWRFGYKTEPNYNDMGLNCGGSSFQWDTNRGKCGLCGDPYGGPLLHEAGGKFASIDRPISRCYNKNSKTMDITAKITAYHKGYFEFRLCVNNDKTSDPGLDCSEGGILLNITGSGQKSRYDINEVKKEIYKFKVDIPENIECNQCILHWKYNTGNSWGCDSAGNCAIGLGAQEQFINCADISILSDCSQITTVEPVTVITPIMTPYTGPTSRPGGNTCITMPTTPDPSVTCEAVGSFASVQEMAEWCAKSCYNPVQPLCPTDQCSCWKS